MSVAELVRPPAARVEVCGGEHLHMARRSLERAWHGAPEERAAHLRTCAAHLSGAERASSAPGEAAEREHEWLLLSLRCLLQNAGETPTQNLQAQAAATL